MSNRTLIVLTFFVLIGIAVLLGLNIKAMVTPKGVSQYLAPGEVRGMAVEHDGKLFTLNFSQQNMFLQYLNQSDRTAEKNIEKASQLPVKRIVIYRFNNSDIDVMPVGYKGKDLLLSAPTLNSQGLLWDTSEGALETLLNSTYDP